MFASSVLRIESELFSKKLCNSVIGYLSSSIAYFTESYASKIPLSTYASLKELIEEIIKSR